MPGSTESTLPGQLDRWVARGLLTPEQAQRILAEERPEPSPGAQRPVSLAIEALGYVGGILILVAAGPSPAVTGRSSASVASCRWRSVPLRCCWSSAPGWRRSRAASGCGCGR